MIVDSIEGIVEYGARIADTIDEGSDRLQRWIVKRLHSATATPFTDLKVTAATKLKLFSISLATSHFCSELQVTTSSTGSLLDTL